MQDYKMINDATEGDFNFDIEDGDPLNHYVGKIPDYSFAESRAIDVDHFPVTGHLQSYFDKDLWAIKLSEGASITVSVLPDLFLPLMGSPLKRELLGETFSHVSVYEYGYSEYYPNYRLFYIDTYNKMDSIASALAVQNGWGLDAGEPSFDDSVLTGSDKFDVGYKHTGLFLIEVSGQPIDLSSTTQKDAGRYLITVGNPTGQRAATWGSDWINTVDINTVVPGQYNSIDPSTPDFVPPDVLMPTNVSDNPQELVSGPIEYSVGENNQLQFSDERFRAC
jgi:hypothetical protein